eukprot:7107855-Prymnesium_polylepis.1
MPNGREPPCPEGDRFSAPEAAWPQGGQGAAAGGVAPFALWTCGGFGVVVLGRRGGRGGLNAGSISKAMTSAGFAGIL